MKKKKCLSASFFVFFCLSLSGWEYPYWSRSPKALLMGDAYTAIADDSYTLFYNPAALGRNEGLSLYIINPEVETTNVLKEQDRLKNFPTKDPVAIADRIMGLPIHLNLEATPGVKMEHFGLSYIAQTNTDLILRNRVNPALGANYNYDRGFIAGYAVTLGGGKGRRKKGGGSGAQGRKTSFGFALKQINRQGLDQRFNIFGLSLIDRINEGSVTGATDLKKVLGLSQGIGWGADMGAEYSWGNNNSQFVVGASALDLFDTYFKVKEGETPLGVQPMTVNVGTSWSQDFFLFYYTLSMDVHPVLASRDIRQKLHFGGQFGIPFISLLAGWNGGYISYGARLHLWPITILAGFYSVEMGNSYRQQEGKRALIYLSLFDFSFDV